MKTLPNIPKSKLRPQSRDVDWCDERAPLYDEEDLEWIREACRVTSEALDYITPHILTGVTTGSIDDRIREFADLRGVRSATLNYHPSWADAPFPAACCISVNEEVNHGIPSGRVLKGGDIVNVDVTLILDDSNGNSWYGDSSRMFLIGEAGEIPPRAKQLVYWTHEAMMAGVREVRPGGRLGDIGCAIRDIARKRRLSVVTSFTGHGIGLQFHDAPQVLHDVRGRGQGMELEPGMVFTIEPMINEGTRHVSMAEDGWTTVTADGKLSAQFEHTVLVTGTGCEILTRSPKGYTKPPYID